MPNKISKDFKILQKLNSESKPLVNKQRTLLTHIVCMLVIVLLVMLFYGLVVLTEVT